MNMGEKLNNKLGKDFLKQLIYDYATVESALFVQKAFRYSS